MSIATDDESTRTGDSYGGSFIDDRSISEIEAQGSSGDDGLRAENIVTGTRIRRPPRTYYDQYGASIRHQLLEGEEYSESSEEHEDQEDESSSYTDDGADGIFESSEDAEG